MKIILSGGTGPLTLLNDLKARITFNRFNGDSLIKSVFPSVSTNASGNIESLIPVGVVSTDKTIQSVVLESDKLTYYMIGVAVLFVGLIFWAFKK